MRAGVIVLVCALLMACSDAEVQESAKSTVIGTRVTVVEPVSRDIDYVLTALGSVESIEHPTVAAETSGRVLAVAVSEGDAVDVGQLLASIDPTLHRIEAAKAQSELKRQGVMLENQRREVSRVQRLAKSHSVSEDQLEDEQAQLEMLHAEQEVAARRWELALHLEKMNQILAPQSGIISRRHISIGDYVIPGQALFDVVLTDTLRARLAFPEHDQASIRIGKEVRLSSPGAPELAANGTVTAINPQINEHSRAIEVTVEFANPGGWYPGASVDATLVAEHRPGAMTVPSLSLVHRNGRDVVFVVKGDRAVARPVTLGWQETDWREVLSGVQPGDRVVVEGAGLISDGSALVVLAPQK